MLTATIPLIPVLVLAMISFTASCYVIIRTLLPIIPAHPLSRRLPRTAFGLPKRKLSPANKATLYIAACDVLALAAFVWQAVVESLGTSVDATSDAGTSARLWVALTTRQTCLLAVAALTYLYVRSGKSLTFGPRDFHVWAPSATLVIVSTACAAGFTATKHFDSFYYGAIAYTCVLAIISTGCFGGFLASLINIRRQLTAHLAAQEEEEWPPLKSKTKVYQPRKAASFATEDVEALREGDSWLTSIRSERTHSSSGFSFTSGSDAHSVAPQSVHSGAAPSSNPYSMSTPAKSTFWFGIPSTANLHAPENEGEDVPPVPELPAAYRRTSSPMGVDADPFRREAPSVREQSIRSGSGDSRAQSVRSGSHASEHSYANSWLTEPSGSVATPTQFSFPTSLKSHPPSIAPSHRTRHTQHEEEAHEHEQFDNVELDGQHHQDMVDYRDSRYGVQLETPMTATAFSPSPRASREILNNPEYEQYRPSSAQTVVTPSPRPILGGYGAYDRAATVGDMFNAVDGGDNKAATMNLDPKRMAGWFLSIWLPFVLALPYLAMNMISSPSPAMASSKIPVILLTLSVTLSSPILALHVLLNSSPVPVLPAAFFAASEGRPSMFGSVVDRTVSSGGPRLPVDMMERNQSQITVHGRRSGDVWMEKGHASDDGKSKFSRALSMTSPIPKLVCMDPAAPAEQDERTLTNPTPEPGAFHFPGRGSNSRPHSPGYVYSADPVIEAASRILAQQAADKAQATRARLSSKVSAFTYATGTSGYEDSELPEEFGTVQQQAKVMIAQRHFSSLAVANMVAIPPASIRSGGNSGPTTPVMQIGGFAAAQDEFQGGGLHALKHSRSRSEMVPSVVRASGVSLGNRSSTSSTHMRSRSAASALLTPNNGGASNSARNSYHRAPLTPPPAFPLPPTPPSVKALPHHQSRSASRQSRQSGHSRSQSHASSMTAGTMQFDIDSIRLNDAVMHSLRQPTAEDTVNWPATPASDGEGYSTTGSSFKFSGFNALDEEEVEALIVGGGPARVKVSVAPSTPKKGSGSSGLKNMASIPDSMASFSSPEVTSTPKKASYRNKWRQHMSLPSLNLGRKGNFLKEEITTALAELGILVADEDSRRRTMYGTETPPRQRSATTHDAPSPPLVSTHATIATKSDVVVPSSSARKSPARSSLQINTALPPIAQRYSRSLTVDQVDNALRTPSPTDMSFVVSGTPGPVQAAPQRVAVTAPLQFHRPIQTPAASVAPVMSREKRVPPPLVYHTTNNQLIRQIEVYNDNQEATTKRSTSPTANLSSASGSALPTHLRAQPRAWPPAAASFARAAGMAASSIASAWSSSSSLPTDNMPPLRNQDSENVMAPSSSAAVLPLYSKSSTGTTASPLRPLSLLQGRNTPATTPGGAAGRHSVMMPKDANYVLPASTRSAGKSAKSTTSSGHGGGKSSTGSNLPLGPTPKSNKSGRRGRQDENRTMGSATTPAGDKTSNNGGTPGSGLKPLRLARSATTKARGLLRQAEQVPDVVVRPPSVYSHYQRDVMA